MTPMRERAAKVAEIKRRHEACAKDPTFPDFPSKEDDEWNIVATAFVIQAQTDRGDLLGYISADPTRSALEECVRAMDAFIKKHAELEPELRGIFTLAYAHGARWPEDKNWVEELTALKASAATARNALHQKE